MPAPPLANTFETGLAEDTAISTTNSDDGTAGDAFTFVSGTAPVFSLLQAKSGTRSMKVAIPATPNTQVVQWGGLGSLTGDVYIRFYAYLPNRPAGSSLRLIRFNAFGGGHCAGLYLQTSNGMLDVLNAAFTGGSVTGAVEVAYNQWIRIECRIRAATSNGQFEWRLYNSAESTTITDTASSSSLVLAANVEDAQYGNVNNAAPASYTFYVDDLAISTTGWIGPSSIAAAREYKRFSGPAQLSGSAATLYTCPTGKRARILHIHASNPSASPVDFNLSIGTDAAATRVYDDYEITADSIEHNYDPYDLAAGDIIQGWASTAGTVVLTITGYEDPA